METKTLDHSSGLRDFWRCYDLLHDTQRYYFEKMYPIYGGPDTYRRNILSGKIVVNYTQEKVGKIVGAVSTQVSPPAGQAYIGYMHTTVRGQGIGSRLLRYTLDTLKNREIFQVHLMCRADLRAYRFFLNHGFEDVTTRDNRVRRMEKNIS